METIHANTLSLWHRRLPVGHDNDREVAIGLARRMGSILVEMSASEKAGHVSIGSITSDTTETVRSQLDTFLQVA